MTLASKQLVTCDNFPSFTAMETALFTKHNAEVCESVLRQGVDFVYAKSSLGNQTVIADFLNNEVRDIESGDNEDCTEMMYRVLCHYYLPPCGNLHLPPPSARRSARWCRTSVKEHGMQLCYYYILETLNLLLIALTPLNLYFLSHTAALELD